MLGEKKRMDTGEDIGSEQCVQNASQKTENIAKRIFVINEIMYLCIKS